MHFPFDPLQRRLGGRDGVVGEYIRGVNSLQCQVNDISTWSRPEERHYCASWECRKDLVIIFGKAVRSGSLRNAIAKNDPFRSLSGCLSFLDGGRFISAVPSFLLGCFPGGLPAPPHPCFLICIFSCLPSRPSPVSPAPFCPHHSFHSPMLEVERLRMLVLDMLRGRLVQHPR